MISLLSSGPHSGTGTGTGSACGATSSCVATGRRGKWRGRGRRRLFDPVVHITLDSGDGGLAVGRCERPAVDEVGGARHHHPKIGRIGAPVITGERVSEFVAQ